MFCHKLIHTPRVASKLFLSGVGGGRDRRMIALIGALSRMFHGTVEQAFGERAPCRTLRLLRQHLTQVEVGRILRSLRARVTYVALRVQPLGNLHGVYRTYAHARAGAFEQLYSVKCGRSLL